ncbi:MAG: hypothetical protein CSB49_05535 [Proteobacteria bacterium]|nr:MAG: hypothetical protein CSB49_05535 [Pseudomonadota bacterium]
MIKHISLLLLALLVAAPFVLTPTVARANPEVMLKQAEKLYEQLEYIEALKVLLQVQQQKTATPIQRARAYLYMGVCFTALGQAQNAVSAFSEVLKLRPRFRLPSGVSPSIRTMFVTALKRLKLPLTPPPAGKPAPTPRQRTGPQKTVDILAKAPLKTSAGKPITVKIDIEDPGKRIKTLTIRWRRIGGPDYSSIKLAYKGTKPTLEATIPVAAVGTKEGRLAYFVEARDAGGQVVARSAGENAPHEIDLTPFKEGSSNWAWWTLGIVGGAAAIAGGVVAIVLLSKGGDTPTSPGTADVTVVLE